MGTWAALSRQPAFNASTMLLLTDGTVMCQDENARSWWRLTPDSTGSYINGAWSALANMMNSRLYYTSAVLADGRVLVAGGEYSDAGGDTDKAEIYDPLADSWTGIGNPGWGQIGDAVSCVLADGRVLMGNLTDGRTALYDPPSNTWADTGSMAARSNEETWTLLPDGSVITVSCANHPQAERYIPQTGTWISAGATPVELVQASSIEIGPAVLMPDGRVFTIGATGHTALYTPSGDETGAGSWMAGPDFPTDGAGRLLKAKDAPACLLPNGRVLCVAGPAGDAAGDWPSPTMFFEFDGANLNRVDDPSNATGVIYEGRMLLLPTGQVLYSAATPAMYVYEPDPGPQQAWKPVITACPTDMHNSATYTLQGQQLNGLSQAVSYGDDAQMATNYPLVRLRDTATNAVYYCRTFNHSTMAVATGSATVSTSLVVPPAVPQGTYALAAVANGIASDEVTVQIDAGSGRAQYLLLDRFAAGDGTLWAYVDGSWRGHAVGQDEFSGVGQDLFAADQVDTWWDNAELTIARGWKTY